jgi:YVTN family beta-propeller protein
MNKRSLKNSHRSPLSRLLITATFLSTVLLFEPQLGNAQNGVVSSTLNGQQIGLLHWYQAGTVAQFPVGKGPTALVFDGEHIWVAKSGDNNLSELDANTGAAINTIDTGITPSGVAFDGASIWVSDFGVNVVGKFQASTGALLGFFATGNGP